MMSFTKELGAFYATIYGGIAIGLLFDIYRSFRHNFKIVKRISLVFDILFWIVTTFITFITINTVQNFNLRYYHIVALFIGYFLYNFTIGKFVFAGLDKLICFMTYIINKTSKYIVSILNNLYYVIIYSIHLLFDTIFYIPNMFLATRKFIRRKSIGKIKIKKRCR